MSVNTSELASFLKLPLFGVIVYITKTVESLCSCTVNSEVICL